MDAPGLTPSDLTDLVRAVVREQFPDLVSGHLVARIGKVLASGVAAGATTHLEPRVTVDVQVLTPTGEADKTWPVITGVRLAVPWSGPTRGAFSLPAVGALVRLSWLYGQADLPMADPYTAEGFETPAGVGGDLVFHVQGTELRISDAGDVTITAAPTKVIRIHGGDVRLGDDAGQPLLTSAFLAHVHPSNGAVFVPIPGASLSTTRVRGT